MTKTLVLEQMKLYLDWCQERNLKTCRQSEQTNLSKLSSHYIQEKTESDSLKKKILVLTTSQDKLNFFKAEEKILWDKIIQALGLHSKKDVRLLSFSQEKEKTERLSEKSFESKAKLYAALKQSQASFLIILGEESYKSLWPERKPWTEVVYKNPSFKMDNQLIHLFLILHLFSNSI